VEIVIVVAVALAVLAGVVLVLRAVRRPRALEHPEVPGEPRPAEAPRRTITLEPPPEPGAPSDAAVLERPRLRDRLGRTRAAFGGYLKGLRGHGVDDETWDDLEEALLLADVGIPTTQRLLGSVRERAKAEHVDDPEVLLRILRDEVAAMLAEAPDRSLRIDAAGPNVWMFVGVNGVGKTTTIGKLAAQQAEQGRRVVLAAADTFRAAAADQLELWAQRTGSEIVRSHTDGADPGSVVFDAMAAASSRGADLVLVDTAGRLHTKTNLMEELKKLRRIVDRTEGALKEVLLVVDASTGQNGLAQARQFAEAVDVTGIVLTKLDGTAKGGIVLAIQSELGIPVKVVGVGEGVEDLIPFDADEFARAMFED
jgi:fused signal recognition particle receptor